MFYTKLPIAVVRRRSQLVKITSYFFIAFSIHLFNWMQICVDLISFEPFFEVVYGLAIGSLILNLKAEKYFFGLK